MAEQEIQFGLEEVDLPERSNNAEKVKTALKEVAENGTPGKWYRIARHPVAQKIASQVQAARAKYGPVEAYGWQFRSAAEELGNGEKVHSLFVSYDPSRVEAGAKETFEDKKAAAADAARVK